MNNYNGYLNLFYSYFVNKFKPSTIIRDGLSIVILLTFEFKLIQEHLENSNLLYSNFLELAIIIPSLLLTNIYWTSFRESDLYRVISYMPVENVKVMIGLNMYILVDVTGKRLIYVLILPFYFWLNGNINLLECFSVFSVCTFLIVTSQLICILIHEYKKKYIPFTLIIVLVLSVFFNSALNNIILLIVLISSSILINYIKFVPSKKKLVLKKVEKDLSNLKWELKKFLSEFSNIIGIIGMLIFINIINYNLEIIYHGEIEFEIKYFLILLIISTISPLNLMFSSDTELRSIAIYMPFEKVNVFISKFLVAAIISQFILFTVVTINRFLFQEKFGIPHIEIAIVLLYVNYIRLRIDMIKPILDYENKNDLWKNPKKYLSLGIVIPIIFALINIEFYISFLIIVLSCLVLEGINILFLKEDFFGYK